MGKEQNLPARTFSETDMWLKTEADREQRERIRNAEVQLLDANLSYREYCQRHDDLRKLIMEPEKPIDEMSRRDYNLKRQVETRPQESELRPGEMSFWQYLQWRKRQS